MRGEPHKRRRREGRKRRGGRKRREKRKRIYRRPKKRRAISEGRSEPGEGGESEGERERERKRGREVEFATGNRVFVVGKALELRRTGRAWSAGSSFLLPCSADFSKFSPTTTVLLQVYYYYQLHQKVIIDYYYSQSESISI